MATILNPPQQAKQRVILRDVSWALYEHLLAEHEGVSNPRFSYDRGTLEIMAPLPEHEELKRDIDILVEMLAEGMDIDVSGYGSTTFRREDFARGFEPNACFYVRDAARMRGRKRIDLTVDPPPDLVIEVDITSPSLGKFPIFAGLGVAEVWRCDGEQLQIFRLIDGDYVQASESVALPGVTGDVPMRFIESGKTERRAAWLRSVREWARSHGASDDAAD